MSNEAQQIQESSDTLDADFAAMQEASEESPVAEVVEQAPVEAPVEEASEKPIEPEEAVKETPDVVPLATFLETKNDLKSTRQEIAALQQQLDALANPPVEPDAEISIDEDPVGHLEQQTKLTNEKISELGDQLKQAQANQQTSSLQNYVNSAEQQFAGENKDYFDSVAHLQQSRLAQYKIMGADENQALQAVNNELINVAQSAIQNGKNPAQVVYELAKNSGFAKPVEVREGDGTLKALAKAQDSSGTLASIPGQSGDDRENVMSANGLSDAEFDKKFVGNDDEFKALFS